MTTAKDFISTFMIAISNCSLYSKEHEAFDDLAKKTLSSLTGLIKDRLEIMMLDSELIVNSAPLRDAGLHKINIIKRFKRMGISRIDFLNGISLSEIKQFIIDMTGSGKDIKTYPHIKCGAVDIDTATPDISSGEYTASGAIDKIKDVMYSASPSKKLEVRGLDEAVLNFIAALKKESNILKYLSPVKSHSEYTYTHAANSAVLSLFQAETLGIDSNMLHDIGIAAILHDVGKMYISNDILEKNGRLDKREFEEIMKHPSCGAAYLAKIDDISRLAPVVAFEHHMKYDMSGYPGLTIKGRKQHIYSQIVAIADFFDALRSRRPYRESMEIKDIIVLMKQGEGKDFNPLLLGNFIRSIEKSLSDS